MTGVYLFVNKSSDVRLVTLMSEPSSRRCIRIPDYIWSEYDSSRKESRFEMSFAQYQAFSTCSSTASVEKIRARWMIRTCLSLQYYPSTKNFCLVVAIVKDW